MGHSLLAFIVVLGVLIFFHEFGHFIVARLCGVGVETFSLGFGHKIYRKKIGFTEYCLSIIPLGGYVKMVGEEPGSPIKEEDIKKSFTHKKLYQKMFIVAAGPLFNFLLAIIIFYVIFQVSGLYLVRPVIGGVAKNSPAMQAGMKKGDIVRFIQNTSVESWSDMADLIGKSKGSAVSVIVERNGRQIALKITPRAKTVKNIFGENVKRYMIGVASSGKVFHKSLNPLQAMGASLSKTWDFIDLTFLSVAKILNGSISSKTLGGPIMIADLAGKEAKAGMADFTFFIAMLSVNLGIINLFPIPVLDGGHIFFFLIEAITGTPVSDRVHEKANQVGIALLVALMVFVFYNDIMRYKDSIVSMIR